MRQDSRMHERGATMMRVTIDPNGPTLEAENTDRSVGAHQNIKMQIEHYKLCAGGHTWALRRRPPVDPPKMGDGVLASRPGGEKGLGLDSFSAVSARATTRVARAAGANARPQRADVGAFKEKGMMSGDRNEPERSKTPKSQRSLVTFAILLDLFVELRTITASQVQADYFDWSLGWAQIMRDSILWYGKAGFLGRSLGDTWSFRCEALRTRSAVTDCAKAFMNTYASQQHKCTLRYGL
jgi:hypothetical protein